MTTLDRHVARSVLKSFALVLLVLVVLFSAAALVRELDDIGKGRYELLDAVYYVVLTVPSRAAELAPMSAFLAGVLGLGALAATREVLAMRAIGQSTASFLRATGVAGLLLVVALCVVVEVVAPPMEKAAAQRRARTISDSPSLMTSRGLWLRDGTRLARFGDVVDEGHLRDVQIYDLDDGGRLLSITHASEAEIRSDGRWRLTDVEVIPFEASVEGARIGERAVTSSLGLDELRLMLRDPATLGLSDLRRQIRSRERRGHDFRRYEFVFWQKLALPLEVAAMLLLSLPFVLGRFLLAGLGARIRAAAVVGVLAYLLSRVSGYAGLVFDADPMLTALTPVVLETLLATVLLWRDG